MGLRGPGAANLPDDDSDGNNDGDDDTEIASDGDDDTEIARPSGPTCAWCC